MVIDCLLRRLNDACLWAQGFANDVTIIVKEKFLNTECKLIQGGLNIFQTWCGEVGLTMILQFTKNKHLVGFSKPILFGKDLELKNLGQITGCDPG
jgi:hypothetical protein